MNLLKSPRLFGYMGVLTLVLGVPYAYIGTMMKLTYGDMDGGAPVSNDNGNMELITSIAPVVIVAILLFLRSYYLEKQKRKTIIKQKIESTAEVFK